jgi:hypothetical protein
LREKIDRADAETLGSQHRREEKRRKRLHIFLSFFAIFAFAVDLSSFFVITQFISLFANICISFILNFIRKSGLIPRSSAPAEIKQRF